VIIHFMKDENVEFLIAHPSVMIASDAMPLPEGKGHPRGVGTFARVLGRYVREKKTVDLLTAIRKMTILPALRAERGGAPMSRYRQRPSLKRISPDSRNPCSATSASRARSASPALGISARGGGDEFGRLRMTPGWSSRRSSTTWSMSLPASSS